MTPEARAAAATDCPTCHARTLPDPLVYSVVASYTCTVCGAAWSARLRNGRPDDRLYPGAIIAREPGDVVSPLTEWPRSRYDADLPAYRPVPARPVPERMR
jgi:hypothetical protein